MVFIPDTFIYNAKFTPPIIIGVIQHDLNKTCPTTKKQVHRKKRPKKKSQLQVGNLCIKKYNTLSGDARLNAHRTVPSHCSGLLGLYGKRWQHSCMFDKSVLIIYLETQHNFHQTRLRASKFYLFFPQFEIPLYSPQ